MNRISGETAVAGVVGAPIGHSLSPLIHNAWIAAAGLDAIYVPFEVAPEGFASFVQGLRSGSVRGLNVTLPYKQAAFELADEADAAATSAGASNLLLFRLDGRIQARNTDGIGLLAAFAEQAPHFRPDRTVVTVVGAGGAGRGAVSALLRAGVPEVRILNRTTERAEALAALFGARVCAFGLDRSAEALAGADALVNATTAGLNEGGALGLPLDALAAEAVVMDMVYRPLRTDLLKSAEASGRAVVDGLAMLIGQAVPTFEALYGRAAPKNVDVRSLALRFLDARP